jgi:hypothetical protein
MPPVGVTAKLPSPLDGAELPPSLDGHELLTSPDRAVMAAWAAQEAELDAEIAALEAAGVLTAPAEEQQPGPDLDPYRLPPRGLHPCLAGLSGSPFDECLQATAAATGDSSCHRPEMPRTACRDRARSGELGFAAGGVGEMLSPGAALACLAEDARAAGLGRLTDDELAGVIRAGRRLSSWAGALELAAVGDLMRRREQQEAAGDLRAAEHVDAEIAALLTLTGRGAGRVLDLAMALRRLPLTARALEAGVIDVPRAGVIADETAGLDDDHAAAVENHVLVRAPGQTTSQVRAAARRAVIAADPRAARKRQEQAQREARVERWDEHAGTAALAGRDLPPAAVIAADQHISALARVLRAAGLAGTAGQLRAQAFLALLSGTPASSLLPPGQQQPNPADSGSSTPSGSGMADQPGSSGNPGMAGSPVTRGGPGAAAPSTSATTNRPSIPAGAGRPGTPAGAGRPGTPARADWPGPSANADWPGNPARADWPGNPANADWPGNPANADWPGNPANADWPGIPAVAGTVNLTMPLSTWLGFRDAPGEVTGFGPLAADDSRHLGAAMARHPQTRWCVTLTSEDGRPVAHGCARPGHGPPPATPGPAPSAHGPARPARSPGGPAHACESPVRGPAPPDHGPAPPDHGPAPPDHGPGPPAWLASIVMKWFGSAGCTHERQSAAYRPPPSLQHLIRVRQQTCAFPGCRRPASQCDLDHTTPFQRGGLTCECNLAPLCRWHHRAKQAPGWHLSQDQPGVMTWRLPSGRIYAACAEPYPV